MSAKSSGAEIEQILEGLDERRLAQEVGRAHDYARESFRIGALVVSDFREFSQVIGAYVRHHHAVCFGGGELPDFQAQEIGKEFISEHYKERLRLTLNSACEDAITGTNGGLRSILDVICDAFKRQSEYRYAESVFDRFVSPNDYADRVEIVRQIMERFRFVFPPSIMERRPEEFASNYKTIIRQIVDAQRNTGRAARR
jgi:hypothetical protein